MPLVEGNRIIEDITYGSKINTEAALQTTLYDTDTPIRVPPCTLVAYNKDCPESRSRLEHDLDAHSTDTAVLGLPGKKVQQRTQRLPNKTKTHPEDAVTDCLAMRATHLLQRRRKSDERQLEYHAEESDACVQSAKVHTHQGLC